jgi:hypothetical protein
VAETPDDHMTDRRPIPDPTNLTTEASLRLEAMLRNLIHAEVTHLDDLFSEKLARIEVRFNMLDARTAEQKQDTTNALNAALAAQKEQALLQNTASQKNIDKSELATTERIKGVEALLATSMKAADDKFSDLKERVSRFEALKLGNVEGAAGVHSSSDNMRAVLTSVVGVLLVVIAAASILVAIFKP